jgi:hypothetical protein
MDVGVNEARDDGASREVDHAVRGRRLAGADAFDVALVDEHPLAGRLRRERVDA